MVVFLEALTAWRGVSHRQRGLIKKGAWVVRSFVWEGGGREKMEVVGRGLLRPDEQ